MKNKQTKLITFDEVFDKFSNDRKQKIEEGAKFYEMLYALRERRENLGLTQADLAEKTQIPRGTINRIETGSRNVTFEKLIKIVDALDLDLQLSVKN
jgi:DNA-binding XRE family transcriptional regulator